MGGGASKKKRNNSGHNPRTVHLRVSWSQRGILMNNGPSWQTVQGCGASLKKQQITQAPGAAGEGAGVKLQSWGQGLHADTQEMVGSHRKAVPLGLWPEKPGQTWALSPGPGFPPISRGCLSAQTPQRTLRFLQPPFLPRDAKTPAPARGCGTQGPPWHLRSPLSPQHPFGFRAGTRSI